MALGNWDSICFDKNGVVGNTGLYVKHLSGRKSYVEFYKNWIYVGDNAIWNEASGFGFPTIAEIHEGEIILSDFRIYAERSDEQNSILAYVEMGYRQDDTFDCMCGVGGYGYSGDNWVGIEKPTLIELVSFLEDLNYVADEAYIEKIRQFVDKF